ncbi:hypothetical protein [Anderseniella sp. Alg231-50]|uniref:hypothetical protein n=1 Tax=Anderseniella sp. Alg231-50 TaxID=1922226 RepID=UPI00307BF1BB
MKITRLFFGTLFFALYAWMSVVPLAAQETTETSQIERLRAAVIERDTRVVELEKQLAGLQQQSLGDEANAKIKAEKLKTTLAYEQSLQAYYVSNRKLREQQQAGFAWQRKAADWILVLVVIITLSGIVFSGFELYTAIRTPISSLQAPATANNQPITQQAVTTIDISATSLKITSAVIGLIVLGFSMAFLYLFLDKVYGIELIDLSGSRQAVAMQGSAK